MVGRATEMLRLNVGDFSSNEPPYVLATAIAYLEATKRGEVARFEWHRRSRDGSLHWDEVVLKAAEIGGQRRVLAITREISDRKRAELALRASEEQYRAIFEAATDSLQLLDAQHRVVDVNPAYERMYGKSPRRGDRQDPDRARAAAAAAGTPGAGRARARRRSRPNC